MPNHKREIHTPVMLDETIKYLNLGDGINKSVIDATLDGGGHATALREKYPYLKIVGIETDPTMVDDLELDPSIVVESDSYVNIEKVALKNNIKPDAIYFDLGVSSWHYSSSGRGFSFQKDQVLDMRFNINGQSITAIDVVNFYTKAELENILTNYGEEKYAKEIAESIHKSRKVKPIISTQELIDIIDRAVPAWYKHKKIHFATKTFQALRMEVNKELDSIKRGLLSAIDVLAPGGRLVVISFHGLEDKTVKEIFKEKVKEGVIKFVTKDTIKPKWTEVVKNRRARSAKMKVVEKI